MWKVIITCNHFIQVLLNTIHMYRTMIAVYLSEQGWQFFFSMTLISLFNTKSLKWKILKDVGYQYDCVSEYYFVFQWYFYS